MVLTVTEDTPADMLAGSMELLVQLPRDHHLHMQKVTVLRRYIYCAKIIRYQLIRYLLFM